jgi:hypothetical protein
MLRLLHSIFGSEQKGSYPESLVREAIERAVEGTDPWLRGVSGYRRKLRPAVMFGGVWYEKNKRYKVSRFTPRSRRDGRQERN